MLPIIRGIIISVDTPNGYFCRLPGVQTSLHPPLPPAVADKAYKTGAQQQEGRGEIVDTMAG